ncbi:Flp pilus assembly protein TadD, contains TPR repeats [Ruegeria halocynthiae]|uniref:Flp pilus assembly protein TadD, contains TPR repeats n=1 Tax=Ruegeria halocynthiae TaxID=985054 RepID=A0A1H2Y3R5_9RHOB|nr:tetratricopeptide repeat protein [Ruegeria halocynthiae]SDW99766.1 Flp pilus assembly protein TadD, contains TPR repeats [Ruegeria halocynthiae]
MLHRLSVLPLAVIITALFLTGCDDSKKRAERHYQSALELLEEGDVVRALVELRNVIKFDVEHKDGRLLYASMLAKTGEKQEAISQYLRVVEQNPDNVEARIPLTRLLLEFNAWEESIRHGRAARELAPENSDVVFLNAVLDFGEATQSGDTAALDAPKAIAESVLAENPSDRLAWRLLVNYDVTAGDFDRALRRIDEALTHLPDEYDLYVIRLNILTAQREDLAIGEALRAMTERFPEDLPARNMLLAWYMEQDDLAAAEAFLRKLAEAPEAGPIENLRIVDFLRQTQDSDSVRNELDRLIAENPEHNTYLATRAALDFEEGNSDAAIATMQELLDGAEASEETANLKVNLARMLFSTGDTPGAKALVDKVLSESQGHVEALKMRAAWQIEDDRPEDAILTLRAAQAGAPRDPGIMVLMGQAHERTGARELAGERYALAVEASGRASGESLRYAEFLLKSNRLDVAETVLTDALNVNPFDIDLLAAMGEILLRQQSWDRVTRVVWQLRAQGSPDGDAAADRIEAALLVSQRRTNEAVAFLSELVEADGNNIVALSNLIDALIQDNQVEEARATLNERLTQDPNNPNLRFIQAGLQIVEGDVDKAEQSYRALLTDFPSDVRALRQLSRILISQGREEELTAVINTAAAAEPDAFLPKYLRAGQLERLRDYEGAIEVYEELYLENSGNQIVANNLASLITTYRDDEESLSRAYAVARRLRGSDVPAYQDTYGWIAFRRGNLTEALDYLNSAASNLPGNPLVHYHLGETYAALGRNENAIEALTKAVELFGDQQVSQADRARELLSSLPSDE